MGELRIVHLLDVRADVTQAHAQPIQTDDLVLKAVGQNRLTLLDQLRLEAAMAVLWSVNLKAASGAFDGLAAIAIAFVAAATLILIKVAVHLGLKSRFNKTFEQRCKCSIVAKQGFPRLELLQCFLL